MTKLLSRLLLLAAAAGLAWTSSAQPVTLRGSETLVPLSRSWAGAFTAAHAGLEVEAKGGGAAAAFTALAARQTDLALVSRSMRYKESQACETALGGKPAEFKVAVSGVAVYVHPANPLKEITYDDLVSLFRGAARSWKQLGGEDRPVLLLGQETNSAAGELFIEEVLNGKPAAESVRFLPAAEVLKEVARSPDAIGFAAWQPADGVRPLAIKRAYSSTPVLPSATDIANRIYPISRFLFVYAAPGARRDRVSTYLAWLRGAPAGQLAEKSGFFALPEKWRTDAP